MLCAYLTKQKLSTALSNTRTKRAFVLTALPFAELVGLDPAGVFKTLVTKGSSKAYFVFVIPIAEELDLKKAAKAVGEKSVEMIHVSEINAVTGYIRGGCSPIEYEKAV